MIAGALALWIAWGAVPPAAPGPAEAGPGAPGASGGPRALFRVLQGGKWGFIDASGRLAIPARFDQAEPFSEGLAAVRLGAKLGYVDETGRMVLEPTFSPAGAIHRPFSSGLAAVRIGNREGFMDRTGKLAIPARYATVDDFSEGLAMACDDQTCAWISVKGGAVVGPGFMSGTPARNGVVAAYVAMGGVLAALVFAISAVSIPMLLDRDVDMVTAIVTSLDAVKTNPLPMAVWAALIVGLTAVGFATGLVGLVVILPVLGHATWHCYRDVVR
jgi:hypothetical protein